MISAQLLKDPREKSNNKIPSGYPHFLITSIPHTNTDEIEWPRIQVGIIPMKQNSFEFLYSPHSKRAFFNFPPPEPELLHLMQVSFLEKYLRMPTVHTVQVIYIHLPLKPGL